ncbi:MAG TPA: ferrous iron transport protein A [bacterium]
MSAESLSVACPRCGTVLPLAGTCGGACGAAGGCALLCCTGCGMGFPHPRRSWLAYRLWRWLARRKRSMALTRAEAANADGRPDAAATLGALPVGMVARILSHDRLPPERAHALAALGLVPGVEVRLRQRHPAFVLEAGETTVAVDAELARGIRVSRVDRCD